jgi:hypothetical protein
VIEEKALNDRLRLIEKELATLSEAFDRVESRVKELEDLKDEIKAMKICLGKHQPWFKEEFLSAMEKITKKGA